MDNNEEVKTEGMENPAPVENIMVADEETKEEEEVATAPEMGTEEHSA